MKTLKVSLILLFVLFGLLSNADAVTAIWNHSSDVNLIVAYRVYYGTTSGNLQMMKEIPKASCVGGNHNGDAFDCRADFSDSSFVPMVIYYFAVDCYGLLSDGITKNPSAKTSEVTFRLTDGTLPPPSDTPPGPPQDMGVYKTVPTN